MNCPICGEPCGETAVTRDEIAVEIALRADFFRRRFASPARREADLRDIAHVAFGDAAPLFRCPACDVYVRGDTSEVFETDRYDRRTLESLRGFHVAEFSRKTWVRDLLPARGEVLEVGSYVGGFLEVARSWGWRITGMDVGADTAAFAGAIHGSLDTVELPPAAFDGVFIWNCFEQLPDPAAALRRCREILRLPGVLLIRTPDAAVYAANRRRRDFLAYSNLLGFPHRFGFTAASLQRLCADGGFALTSMRHEPAMRPHRDAMPTWAQEEEGRIDPAAWIEAVFRV